MLSEECSWLRWFREGDNGKQMNWLIEKKLEQRIDLSPGLIANDVFSRQHNVKFYKTPYTQILAQNVNAGGWMREERRRSQK